MPDQTEENNFTVVGIGGSAGALEALEHFFSNAPADAGMSYVVVQHLSPDYKSLMVELLSRHTEMPVYQVTDGLEVEQNAIYLIPPGYNMTFADYKLLLTDRPPKTALNLPVDILFNSLAAALNEKAIAVILSGTGSDGTRGIRRIKEYGGTIFVQDPESASFDGMPRNALATQLVDFVLTPQEMPQKLAEFVRHPFLASDTHESLKSNQDEDALDKVFTVLQQSSGVDFSLYKQSTMIRRIERRMSINQIHRLYDYLVYLYQSPLEVQTLYKDLLIGVTSFFRDPEAFEVLGTTAFDELVLSKTMDQQLRVWIPACSTGEEAYTIAIMLREKAKQHKHYPDIKIFATDLDKDALEFAAKGVYPESIAADVPPNYLQNYFVKRANQYEVQRTIRDMVIFARQDLSKDPPFSRIDLITCRNVLIYFQPSLQKRVLANFEFALNPNGYLMLGSSETTGDNFESFVNRHNRWRIYQFSGVKGSQKATISRRLAVGSRNSKQQFSFSRGSVQRKRQEEGLLRRIIDNVVSPCLVVDLNQNLLHAFGEVKQYLVPPSGYGVNLDVLRMVPQELGIAMATAMQRAANDDAEIYYENVSFTIEDQNHVINLRCRPFTISEKFTDALLLVFEPLRTTAVGDSEDVAFDFGESTNQRIRDLEQELQHTRENLQALVEELETSNEELQATNEELLAANEELQSTNEELQAVNEELLTVNVEYQSKIRQLVDLNDDIDNLLRNTNVGTLFLDDQLLVRKFTPLAQTEFNLLEQDIGRDFFHLTHNFGKLDVHSMARKVLGDLQTIELETKSDRGVWYLLKMMPFRSNGNTVTGVIITMIDISQVKAANNELALSQDRLQAMSASSFDGVVITQNGIIQFANDIFTELLGFDDNDQIIGEHFDKFIAADSRELFQRHKHADKEGKHEMALALQSPRTDEHINVSWRSRLVEHKDFMMEIATIHYMPNQVVN